MSQTVYDLSDRAKHALVALHEEFKGKIASSELIIKPPGYWSQMADEYEERMQRIIRGSFTEVDNDRQIRVRCPRCHREGAVRGTQNRWSCCGEDHHTFSTTVEV